MQVHFFFFFFSGPALSGTLVNTIGFEWMLFGIAILNFIYAPFMYFLKAPPTKEEKKVINFFFFTLFNNFAFIY